MAEDVRFYSVGEVSEALGVHWRTIHNWEAAGLVAPGRAGNRRVYTGAELEHLRHIKEMTREFRPHVVARILELERRIAELEAQLNQRKR